MQDVQSSFDPRNVALKKVGVKNVRYPITVLDKINKVQHTTGLIDLFANLPHHFKGTHMSRFIEVFHQHHRSLSMKQFLSMLDEVRTVLDAEEAYGNVRFPYYIAKTAPASGQESYLEYQCGFSGHVSPLRRRFYVAVEVPVMTLCPCSREISERGAHNQRGHVRVKVLMGQDFFWLEDLVILIESCASSGLYTLLKREDEKFVTEYSYDHPVFVEDLVRDVTVKLEDWGIFPWFEVQAENMESIHNHEAYAAVERGVDQ
jgi:GTP cyclohydrolase IB